MLGLVTLHAEIGSYYQYGLVMYFCRFIEDVPLAASSPKQCIYQNMIIGTQMLPLTKANKQFQMQYSVIYSDWDILRSNSNKKLPRIFYDLCQI